MGKRIQITFLHFDILATLSCSDQVELDNFSKHCGSISQPWSFISNTNTLNVTFISGRGYTYTGFVAVWTATSELPTYPTPTGCDSCNFPFPFGDTTFETCISIQDLDTQPWCSYSEPPNYTPPANEGTHILPSFFKISCSDSDSSCPNLPPQMVLTSPNYPLNYPRNADQVTWNIGSFTFRINFWYLYRPGHFLLLKDRG